MKARIRRKDESIPLPKYSTPESACFDLASAEGVSVQPGEIVRIHTGLYFECPEGHFLAVFPRSSTPKKFSVTFPHSVGILDRDYAGPDDELLIQVRNFTEKAVEIKKGDRIAQGMFLPVQQVEWDEQSQLRSENRGGFGSTGH